MGDMPALPHPLTLEDQMLARNRGRLRRELWGQSLFVAGAYAAFAMLGLLLWLRVDAARLLWVAALVERHQVTLAVLAMVTGVAATQRASSQTHAAISLHRTRRCRSGATCRRRAIAASARA